MNSENSKTSEPHRFKLNLTDQLNLKDPKKNMTLANLSIHCTLKDIKWKYNNNRFKISAPMLCKNGPTALLKRAPVLQNF